MHTLQHCWWQILVATVAYFALGALWFNQKTLGAIWARSHGISINPEDMKKAPVGRIMGLGFVCTYFICAIICWVCCQGMACSPEGVCMSPGMLYCIKCGLAVGLAAFLSISIGYLYQMKPLASFLTDGLYHLCGCVIAAAVLHGLGCC